MNDHPSREKFATQLDSALLSALRGLAKKEGRQLQSLVEEAVAGLLEDRRTGTARARIIQAHRESVNQFGLVYKNLAK
ncbi:MAG: hypothetical protein WBQ60_12815 [Asticcacaulis sp.]